MPSKLENRIYLGAFALVLLITVMLVSYLSGHAAEEASRLDAIETAVEEQQAVTAQEREQADYWQGKYAALTHEADAVTVMAAAAAFEQGRNGR